LDREWFVGLNPIIQALIATLFTWFLTALGAGLVFFFKRIQRKILDGMLGFAAGVMIAASYWSLLAPAIEMAEESNVPGWLPATFGFLLGGSFLWLVDKVLPHLHLGLPIEEAEGINTSWHRSILLVLAITLHNIPEGLAVGVAFGAVAAGVPDATLEGHLADRNEAFDAGLELHEGAELGKARDAAIDDLAGGHGPTIVAHPRAGKTPLVKRLTQPMLHVLGRLVTIPLCVTADPAPVVQRGERLRGEPITVNIDDPAFPFVKVPVPQGVVV